MNRRSPVRSVLAQRKMFANGGMLPISTPMQNTMDQGQNKASGILASSTPLIEAVSQEILAPMTGGAMPMAQGGSVVDTRPAYVFQEGGGIRLGEPSQFLSPQNRTEVVSKEPTVSIEALPSPDDFFREAMQLADQGVGIIDISAANEFVKFRMAGDTQEEALVKLNSANETVSETVIKSAPAPISLISDIQSGVRPEIIGTSREEQAAFMRGEPNYLEGVKTTASRLRESKNYNKDFNAFLKSENFSDEFKSDVTELLSTSPSKGSELVQRIQSGDGYAEAERDANMQITEDVYGSGPELVRKIQSADGYSEAERDANMQITEDVYGSGPEDKKYTQDLGVLTDYLRNNSVSNKKDIPESVIAQSVNSIIDESIKGLKKKPFDKEAFKAEIDSLLPVVEEDPEMEGALITMLGASIMAGTDPNWAVNLGKGFEKAMPAFINYRTKKKGEKRDRDMAVAKLVLQEGLSRDAETRKAISNLQNQRTAFGIKEAQRILTPKDWWVSESVTLDPRLLGGKEGDPGVFVPKGTTLSLNEVEYNKFSSIGGKALPFDRGTWKLSDFLEDNESIIGNAEHVKAMNAYGNRVTAEVFGKFNKGDAYKINYYTPSFGAVEAGAKSQNMINASDYKSFVSAYQTTRMPTINLLNDINEIGDIVTNAGLDIQGFGNALAQAKDIAKGVGGALGEGVVKLISGYENYSEEQLKNIAPSEQVKVRSIITLARLAPILLDESGKTISDADRRLIAGTLGLNQVPVDPNDPTKGFRIELDASMFYDPQKMLLAISQTQQAIVNRLEDINMEAQVHLNQFGVPSDITEMLNIEKEQQRLLAPTSKFAEVVKQNEGVDFNLTGGT